MEGILIQGILKSWGGQMELGKVSEELGSKVELGSKIEGILKKWGIKRNWGIKFKGSLEVKWSWGVGLNRFWRAGKQNGAGE